VIDFKPGQRVRIKPDAFPGSDDPADVAARGQIGTLLYSQGEDLWWWRGDSGAETSPIESELEVVEEVTP
jgi:hypothetical protein